MLKHISLKISVLMLFLLVFGVIYTVENSALIPSLKTNASAGYIIQETDLRETRQLNILIPKNALRTKEEIVGKTLSANVKANKPILIENVGGSE